MQEFMTTEELIRKVNTQETVAKSTKEIRSRVLTKTRVKKTFKTFFWIALGLAILHTIYSIIPMVTNHRGVNLLGKTSILAIPNDQELDQDLLAKVIRVEKFNFDDIQIGDRIIVYGKFSSELYWVEEVTQIHEMTREIDTTFGYFIQNTYREDEVVATYLREVSQLGQIYYVGSTPRGLISLLAIQGIILTLIYYYYVRKPQEKK